MNENPTAREVTQVCDSNALVSPPQQVERLKHYFGSTSCNQLLQVEEFALQTTNTLAYLKRVGKSLGFRVTQTAAGGDGFPVPSNPRRSGGRGGAACRAAGRACAEVKEASRG